MDNLQVPDKDIRYQRHSRDLVLNETQVESKTNDAWFDVKKFSDGKIDEVLDDNKKSSNPTDLPRSRSHFQVLFSLFINFLKRTSLSDVTFLEFKF